MKAIAGEAPEDIVSPEMARLVERFNQTLKQMLKLVVDETGRNWNLLLLYALFTICERPRHPLASHHSSCCLDGILRDC